MASEEHLAILEKGVQAWNEWREKNPEIKPDFRWVNLTRKHLAGANLAQAHFVFAKLYGVNLNGANLSQAYFGGADLRKAKLSGANLTRASLFATRLRDADMSGADLNGADLAGAQFRWTNVRGADLSNARMRNTVMVALDLSEAKGLETVTHRGPSSIGIDTIVLSKAKIPEEFLRKAGVPEPFITEAMKPFAYCSCFISYSTNDQEFAEKLYGDLKKRGVHCWFAPHRVRGARKLLDQIKEAINSNEKVLLILSTESMASEWVRTELAETRKREVQEKKQLLFPLRLVPFDAIRNWECFDADIGKDSAREIREYFIPDFSDWKDADKYEAAFEHLVRDLMTDSREA
jgi:uncharacterized protein YjbI with pentapeptide repeats